MFRPKLEFHIIAECVRAFVGVNDASSPWPAATRARLRAIDPPIEAAIAKIFARDF